MQEVLDDKRLEQEEQKEEEVKEPSTAVVDPSKHGLGDKIYS